MTKRAFTFRKPPGFSIELRGENEILKPTEFEMNHPNMQMKAKGHESADVNGLPPLLIA